MVCRIAQWDPSSQRYYFVQPATGTTQWDIPTTSPPGHTQAYPAEQTPSYSPGEHNNNNQSYNPGSDSAPPADGTRGGLGSLAGGLANNLLGGGGKKKNSSGGLGGLASGLLSGGGKSSSGGKPSNGGSHGGGGLLGQAAGLAGGLLGGKKPSSGNGSSGSSAGAGGLGGLMGSLLGGSHGSASSVCCLYYHGCLSGGC